MMYRIFIQHNESGARVELGAAVPRVSRLERSPHVLPKVAPEQNKFLRCLRGNASSKTVKWASNKKVGFCMCLDMFRYDRYDICRGFLMFPEDVLGMSL